jgi:hypothetical protein
MDARTLKRSRIDFILVSVRGEEEELSNRIAGILTVCEKHGASAEVAGGIVLSTYVALADDERGDQKLESLIGALKRGFLSDIKIVFGSEFGHSGFLVGPRHLTYNILLPHLTEARHRLHDISWGEALQFNARTPAA